MSRARTTGLIRGSSEAPRLIGETRSASIDSDEIPEFRETAEPTIEVVLAATARERIADDLFALTRADGSSVVAFCSARSSTAETSASLREAVTSKARSGAATTGHRQSGRPVSSIGGSTTCGTRSYRSRSLPGSHSSTGADHGHLCCPDRRHLWAPAARLRELPARPARRLRRASRDGKRGVQPLICRRENPVWGKALLRQLVRMRGLEPPRGSRTSGERSGEVA
jgi:hypothetical protein